MNTRLESQFDVFVAFAAADEWWVRGFLLPSLAVPERRVLTEDDFRPGAPRLEEFASAVTASRFTVVILTPDFLTDTWADLSQRLAAHLGVAERRNRLVPLLFHPCDLPLDLDSRVSLDCTQPEGWEPAAARLRALLDSPVPAETPIPCPYPGLLPFTGGDAELFFGREPEVRRLAQLVPRVPMVFVVGPSGSGKSSLVSAGLLPELRRREADGWLIRTMRPGADPMRALRETLDWADPRPALAAVSNLIRRQSARRLLLVVDQFEELFVQAPSQAQAEFVRATRLIAGEAGCVCLFVLRADFYPDLMGSELWPVPAGQRLEIVPPRGDALRAAIELPARHRGVHLEPALLERLVADAAAEPGALPLLQETLRGLWDGRRRHSLTLADYQAAGRDGANAMATALATWADAALASLDPDQRTVAQRIFLRCVHLGDGREDTRRSQPVDALRVAGDDPAAFDRVLRHLVDRRLVTIDGGDGGGAVVDLAHEAVISGWPTLRQWVAEGREAELLRRRIERDAREWRQAGRHRTLLYRGRRLRNAREWRSRYSGEPSPTLLSFLAAGRRLDLALRGIAGLTAAAALAGVAWLTVPVERRWELRREAARASPMVHLAGGPAILGGLDKPGPRQQTVVLAAFSIDRHEVSNRQYKLCMRAGACSRPLEPADYQGIDSRPDLPVAFVTAYQAADFCRWLGRRLPTGAEWERAARGQHGRPWPWGTSAATPRDANVGGDRPGVPLVANPAPSDVADPQFASGSTPEGIADLAGNLSEWTSTPTTCGSTPYTCAQPFDGRSKVNQLEVRGPSFQDNLASPAAVSGVDTNLPSDTIGIRCANNG